MTNQAFIFKVCDYTTELVGRRMPHPDRERSTRDDVDQWVYYVERGDGTQYRYDDYCVEWARELVERTR